MRKIADIQTGFQRNIVNNTVSIVTDKHAVAQYIYNLLMTNTIEIPFKEWSGSGLNSLLGEACSNITASIILEQIRSLIEKYIPYIELQDMQYKIDYDNQTYRIIIYYNLVNETELITQELTLERTA